MKKKIMIIGAGVAGLSAGCYLQMNGFDTEIFELGLAPGGLCTGWKRKNYSFDGCIHWLVGTSPVNSFYKIWNELMDMKQLDTVDYTEYCALEDEDGNRFTAYTDINQLEQEMIRISPEDAHQIKQFIHGIRSFLGFALPVERPMELMPFSEKIKMAFDMVPKLPLFLKWYGLTNQDFANKLHHPLLKRFFTTSYPGCFSMIVTLINSGWLHQKGAGYPLGGSSKLSGLMEKRYTSLGGILHYQSKVDEILVKDNHACGVRVHDQEYPADIVVSAADGRSTIYDMLQGKYKSKDIIRMYEKQEFNRPAAMMFFSVGVDKTFDAYPHWLFFPLHKEIVIDDKTKVNELPLTIINYDPTAATPGKTCMTIMLSSNDYDYWVNQRANHKAEYDHRKNVICNEIIDALDAYFGDFKEHVEVYDLATPATYVRYTANWMASAQGWSASKETFTQSIAKQLPGLADFYMAGQWVEFGGGVPMCMMSGRNVAQIICKKEDKAWETLAY